MPIPNIPGGHHPAPISGTISSTQSATGVRRIQHGEHGFVLRAAPFRRHRDLHMLARHELGVNHRRGVVAGVGALERGVRHDGGAQLVLRVEIGAPHAFIDHGLEIESGLPLHAHAHLDEDHHDARVLADGPMPFGAQAGVGENLRDGVPRRGALLHVVGAAHGPYEIRRVVVGNVLQGCGDAVNHIGFTNHGHVVPTLKTNWAANLASHGRPWVANPLQSQEIGEMHAACVAGSRDLRLGERLVWPLGRVGARERSGSWVDRSRRGAGRAVCCTICPATARRCSAARRCSTALAAALTLRDPDTPATAAAAAPA